jgi:hypothetical protein
MADWFDSRGGNPGKMRPPFLLPNATIDTFMYQEWWKHESFGFPFFSHWVDLSFFNAKPSFHREKETFQ